ncbi:unnamed protein product [Paramecium sonneborni]|uniref:Transmembrane protein n=1 Tax=Paramecium sonneborni TaxID=65129 RepID=A0A8S1Q0J0_9CILI|nr:unnamed protein product [Paramecium sonneborni]
MCLLLMSIKNLKNMEILLEFMFFSKIGIIYSCIHRLLNCRRLYVLQSIYNQLLMIKQLMLMPRLLINLLISKDHLSKKLQLINQTIKMMKMMTTRKEKIKEKLKNLRKNDKPFQFNIQKNILFTYTHSFYNINLRKYQTLYIEYANLLSSPFIEFILILILIYKGIFVCKLITLIAYLSQYDILIQISQHNKLQRIICHHKTLFHIKTYQQRCQRQCIIAKIKKIFHENEHQQKKLRISIIQIKSRIYTKQCKITLTLL